MKPLLNGRINYDGLEPLNGIMETGTYGIINKATRYWINTIHANPNSEISEEWKLWSNVESFLENGFANDGQIFYIGDILGDDVLHSRNFVFVHNGSRLLSRLRKPANAKSLPWTSLKRGGKWMGFGPVGMSDTEPKDRTFACEKRAHEFAVQSRIDLLYSMARENQEPEKLERIAEFMQGFIDRGEVFDITSRNTVTSVETRAANKVKTTKSLLAGWV